MRAFTLWKNQLDCKRNYLYIVYTRRDEIDGTLQTKTTIGGIIMGVFFIFLVLALVVMNMGGNAHVEKQDKQREDNRDLQDAYLGKKFKVKGGSEMIWKCRKVHMTSGTFSNRGYLVLINEFGHVIEREPKELVEVITWDE